MRITLNLPDGQILKKDFTQNSVVIGRSSKASFSVVFEGLSRFHAQIDLEDGQFFVTDLESSNGVWLEGERIPVGVKTPFAAFQEIFLGPVSCQVDESVTMIKSITKTMSRLWDSTQAVKNRTMTRVSSKIKTSPLPMRKPKKYGANWFQKLLPFLVLAVGVVIYQNQPPKTLETKGDEAAFLDKNVPEKFKSVQDEFFKEYSLNSDGIPLGAEVLVVFGGSFSEGEGAFKKGDEVVVFLDSPKRALKSINEKIKNREDQGQMAAINVLMNSKLMDEFGRKEIAQIHLVLIKEGAPFRVLRFHTKYFSGSEHLRLKSLMNTGLLTGDLSEFEKSFVALVRVKIL